LKLNIEEKVKEFMKLIEKYRENEWNIKENEIEELYIEWIKEIEIIEIKEKEEIWKEIKKVYEKENRNI
jgi:hypothetical protein